MSHNQQTIRLACVTCDRDDGNGIDQIPPGWQDVSREQTYAESLRPVKQDGPGSVLKWWTHLGTCPECAAAEDWDQRGMFELDFACPACGETWQEWWTTADSDSDCPLCGYCGIAPNEFRKINAEGV